MATFALSWNRSRYWAAKLHKPFGRAVSNYHSYTFEEVERIASHINSLEPEMGCRVEVFK
jgi:hypothetical protein